LWVQEEPENQGAWGFIENRINKFIPKKERFKYVGRKESPSPAAGQVKIHTKELIEFLEEAFK
ncbi:MAG: hypothetical protein HUU45_15535, partial [Leptospiraceae bacterium]|nr:hypothetical protein [Leptospiraceae bacterium]